jgi:Ser/Thr protein kinase RdoA (MazF antagonist)
LSPAAAAAVTLARELGLRVDEPVVLRDLTNVLVHLRPSPVVARVSVTLAGRGAQALRNELEFARMAAEAGAPVVPPAAGVPAVPHAQDGHTITFWRFVEHRRAEPADAAEVGQSLRALHEAMRDVDLRLPAFDRLDEVTAELAAMEPEDEVGTSDELRLMQRAVAAARERLLSLRFASQPLHGDAHSGNVFITDAGPLWSDLENVCLGPVEYDLACLVWRDRVHEGTAGVASAHAYGSHDQELVDALQPALGAFLAVWTTQIARRHRGPDIARILNGRLDYLRTFA